MRRWNLSRYALNISITAALLAGCGGSQPPIGAPGAMPQIAVRSLTASREHRESLTYQVLHRFNRPADGQAPAAPLIDVNHTLYGTTTAGGKFGNGTVYSISTSGAEKTLYSFRGGLDDGAVPNAGLVNVKGTLYGTTSFGGATYGSRCLITGHQSGCGTVFAITQSGQEKVIYSFTGGPVSGGGDDGSYPVSGLIDVNGTLYGTTNDGGSGSFGTVYSVGTTGSEKVLHSFSGSGDGAGPAAGLIDVKGTLYGTTEGGGTAECDCGTVFSITIAGVEMVLHSFAGSTGDGERPTSGLIDVNGTLYGTTSGGGKYGSQPGCGGGCGTVYAITTTGKESLVYDFTGSEVNDDGSAPRADLVDMDGALYGTTSEGGEACHDTLCACHFVGGCGTVFSVTTTGAETVLHRFTGGTDGALPIAGLLDVNGTLYGTTEHASSYHRHGGPRGPGTVFALTP